MHLKFTRIFPEAIERFSSANDKLHTKGRLKICRHIQLLPKLFAETFPFQKNSFHLIPLHVQTMTPVTRPPTSRILARCAISPPRPPRSPTTSTAWMGVPWLQVKELLNCWPPTKRVSFVPYFLLGVSDSQPVVAGQRFVKLFVTDKKKKKTTVFISCHAFFPVPSDTSDDLSASFWTPVSPERRPSGSRGRCRSAAAVRPSTRSGPNPRALSLSARSHSGIGPSGSNSDAQVSCLCWTFTHIFLAAFERMCPSSFPQGVWSGVLLSRQGAVCVVSRTEHTQEFGPEGPRTKTSWEETENSANFSGESAGPLARAQLTITRFFGSLADSGRTAIRNVEEWFENSTQIPRLH